jgi:hypothetical protein
MCSPATPHNTFTEKLCWQTLSHQQINVGVHIKSMAHFQLPTYVPRYKVLNLLATIWIASFIACLPDSHALDTEEGENYLSSNMLTALCHLNNIFFLFHILLH